MTVSELGERALLARVQAKLGTTGRRRASLVIGIGDDAAVVAPTRNTQTVLTTDALVEGVHFERRFSAPADIGYRALAVNLSDLASMGARPRWSLISLVMPDALLVSDVEELVGAVAGLGQTEGCEVIGGNLTRSPGPLIVDVTAVGEVKPRRVITRSGARPGDALWLSGTIGAAAAGLEMLRAMPDLKVGPSEAHRMPNLKVGPSEAHRMPNLKVGPSEAHGMPDLKVGPSESAEGPGFSPASCIARYLRPEPRVRLGVAVAHARAARAAMDLSDGLGDAAHQLADASGCGVEIDADALPIDPAARTWWEGAGNDAVLQAVTSGDDYELLFAVPRMWAGRLRHARSRVAAPTLTRIGVFTKDPGMRVLLRHGRREALPGGFEHWK